MRSVTGMRRDDVVDRALISEGVAEGEEAGLAHGAEGEGVLMRSGW
jgi:hypothetical protein